MRGSLVLYVVGIGLLGLAVLMALFDIYAFLLHEDLFGFLETALAAALCGAIAFRFGKPKTSPTRQEAIASVLLLWLLIPLVSIIPYVVSGHLSPVDALFESMSGFTTTGATVIQDFASFPQSLFLWRSLTQWFGGIGIVVLVIAVLPQLAIAGRQLFFTESPGPTEDNLFPRLQQTASAVLIVYIGLTLACFLAYWLAGMSLYNAANHALTTLAAGGFSPEGRSFEAFSPQLVWICSVFMLFAGANFTLLYRAFSGNPRLLLRDAEFRVYLAIALLATLGLTLFNLEQYQLGEALRHGIFQSLSILTTTGYASADFIVWSEQAQMILLILMFIGGSAGSAAGGIKVVRWMMLVQNARREIRLTLHPRGIFAMRLGQRSIPEDVMRAVVSFMMLYLGLLGISTALLVFFGTDIVTAFSAVLACLGNVGPGLGSVGPMANFADLPAISKVLLCFDMYAGRLEVVTVFVLFTPSWWRLPR